MLLPFAWWFASAVSVQVEMAADKLHRDASELLEKLGRWADAFRELPNH